MKTHIPKVPKHCLIPHLNVTTDQDPSSLIQELEPEAPGQLATENTSHEALLANESLEGPHVTHRTFVPMPPICSDSTVHSETVSHPSCTAGLLSPDHPSDDAKSTESIFLTQVTVLSSSIPLSPHHQLLYHFSNTDVLSHRPLPRVASMSFSL